MNDLIQFIEETLGGHDPNQQSVSRWLSRIGDSPRCRQLAACIGIDLILAALPPRLLAELISLAESFAVTDKFLTASDAFQAALDKFPHTELLCRCQTGPSDSFSGQYCRVLDALDFITYYDPYKAISHRTACKVRQAYPHGTMLGLVKTAWRGALPIIWVSEKQELDAILSESLSGGETRIARQLGLTQTHNSLGEPPEFFVVDYPLQAPSPGYKPTVLDQRWNVSHRYVSFHRSSTWGQTVPVPPEDKGASEHVHKALEAGLTDEYILRHLGVGSVRCEHSDVADAALARFKEAHQQRGGQ